jgi:pantoate--beta-alanine ligase
MKITAKIEEVRALRWSDPGLSWGFVPTMGYLHEGHLGLARRAKGENDRAAVSIYVNPAQFGPQEDLANYPRSLERDLELLREVGVDLVFTPDDSLIYPPNFQTKVSVEGVSRPLEGSARPGHFDGVATVVAKLFNIVQPRRAYFGQKDAQQTVVLRRMVIDLNFPVEMVICPTVREPDGLAMSSRNSYLTPEQRTAATILYRALTAAQAAFAAGERSGDALRALMRDTVAAEPLARLDYVSAANPLTLAEWDRVEGDCLLSLAVFVGRTRLIDNILLEGSE